MFKIQLSLSPLDNIAQGHVLQSFDLFKQHIQILKLWTLTDCSNIYQKWKYLTLLKKEWTILTFHWTFFAKNKIVYFWIKIGKGGLLKNLLTYK